MVSIYSTLKKVGLFGYRYSLITRVSDAAVEGLNQDNRILDSPEPPSSLGFRV